MDTWTTADALTLAHPEVGSTVAARQLLERLRRDGLVERGDTLVEWPWQTWTPDAAAYHFGTRGGIYPVDPLANDARLRRKARHDPPPPSTTTRHGRRVSLPSALALGALSQALLNRRTWRTFGDAPLRMSDLATLLNLTWGVQKRGRVRGQGDVVLKTSPSGGARHPLEAYVLAPRVDGLRAGIYHYDANTHELVDLRRRTSRGQVEQLLGRQYYFAGAAAVVVMAAVFGRTMWRYPSSRVYRSIQIEAGHLAQTFCLVATALELAPFTTIAFDDTSLDAAIGLDGIHEGAIYAVGVGTRPRVLPDNPGVIHGRSRNRHTQ